MGLGGGEATEQLPGAQQGPSGRSPAPSMTKGEVPCGSPHAAHTIPTLSIAGRW